MKMSNNRVKCEVLMEQYLRSILDISEILTNMASDDKNYFCYVFNNQNGDKRNINVPKTSPSPFSKNIFR